MKLTHLIAGAEVLEGRMAKLSAAHDQNMDAAQREIDQREAEGEDMSEYMIDPKTYKIVKISAMVKKGISEDKMQFPGCKVVMLQSWKTKLKNAIKELGYDVTMSGYEDSSTKVACAFEIPKKFDIKKFEDQLRDKLQMDGYMSVKPFDMVEEELTEDKMAKELSSRDKAILLADFKEWSGGIDPQDCPWDGDEDEMSVRDYIATNLPSTIRSAAAKRFLRSLCEEQLDEAKKKKKKKRRLKKGDKVKHGKTGTVGVVSGPLYVGGGIRFWPVIAHIGGHSCETGWHDHDTHGANDNGDPVGPPPPPPSNGDSDMGGDMGGGDGGDGGGGGE